MSCVVVLAGTHAADLPLIEWAWEAARESMDLDGVGRVVYPEVWEPHCAEKAPSTLMKASAYWAKKLNVGTTVIPLPTGQSGYGARGSTGQMNFHLANYAGAVRRKGGAVLGIVMHRNRRDKPMQVAGLLRGKGVPVVDAYLREFIEGQQRVALRAGL